jgi:hypothetical protein
VPLDAGQRLGEHQRRGAALHHPRDDQQDRARRQAARQRRQGEHAHPQQEDAPVAVGLAQPGASYQQDREGDQVTADDQLERRS